MTRHTSNRHAAGLTKAALFLALAALSLALPTAVLGHAELATPTPADKSTVTQPVTEVSGTYTEAIKADGSSLLVKDSTGVTVAQGGVDPSNAKVMTATPAIPLPNGAYTVQWTTISASDGDVARGTWTFTVAVAAATATPAASATAAATTAPSTAPSAAPTATPAATIAPSPSPSGGSDTSGGGSDVILPIIVALIVLGAGAAYLLSRRRTTPGT